MLKPYDPLADEQTDPQQPMGISTIESAQINQQIATAKAYPRNITKFLATATTMATADQEIAQECYYKLKRKQAGSNEDKFIEGPSVRLLEICAAAYCNLHYGSRPVRLDQDFVVCEGAAWDMENNVRATQEVWRRITTKEGNRFSPDMIVLTTNAASSIAKRNALNGIVPRVYVNKIMERAKLVALGKETPFVERRQKILTRIAQYRVTEEQVLEYLEIDEIAKMTEHHLETLIGVFTAIKDGETKVEDEFPPLKQEPKGPNFVGKEPAKDKPAAKEPTPQKEAKKPETATPKVETKPEPKPEPKVESKEPVAEKEPVQESKPEPETKPAKQTDPSISEDRRKLEALMERDGVSAERLFYFCTSIHKPALIIKSGPIKELWAVSDAKLRLLYGNWEENLPQLKDDSLFPTV